MKAHRWMVVGLDHFLLPGCLHKFVCLTVARFHDFGTIQLFNRFYQPNFKKNMWEDEVKLAWRGSHNCVMTNHIYVLQSILYKDFVMTFDIVYVVWAYL